MIELVRIVWILLTDRNEWLAMQIEFGEENGK
jgi:hypothetical protein